MQNFPSGSIQFLPVESTMEGIAQQQAIIFDGKAIGIGGDCIVASGLEGKERWIGAVTDSSQVHYVHCLL